jgi:hypothetical protein
MYAIIGSLTLNVLGAIVSNIHMAIKFLGDRGTIITIRGEINEGRNCLLERLKIVKAPLEMNYKLDSKGKKIE